MNWESVWATRTLEVLGLSFLHPWKVLALGSGSPSPTPLPVIPSDKGRTFPARALLVALHSSLHPPVQLISGTFP